MTVERITPASTECEVTQIVEDMGYASVELENLTEALISGDVPRTPMLEEAIGNLTSEVCRLYIRYFNNREADCPIIIESSEL